MKKNLLFIAITALVLVACKKDTAIIKPQSAYQSIVQNDEEKAIYVGFPETMEAGTKTSYTTANVALSTGSWTFNNAVIGTSTSDRKTGSKSARIQNTGLLKMNFDVTNGAVQVSVGHGVYGSDAASTWELDASQDAGSNWTKIGSTITTSSTTLSTVNFTMSYTGNVRFQIKKLSGGKLNIDNIYITDASAVATRDDNMGMGNPTGAATNIAIPNNYLLVKSQYALSYNNSLGTPNWVSWHLSTAWTGTAARCDCFTADNTLPTGFVKVTSTAYTNSGFDRGHQCPSADRNANSTDNAATFLMTNMMPQAPNLNQITWEALETYCRTLISQGNELYITSGGYGQGGTGSNGGTTSTINNGQVNVPSHFWKIIVVLPIGTNDVSRVTASTRVIAVDMPNVQTVNSQSWGYYRTSVDAIESITGYDFLNNVPVAIQSTIESSVDTGATN